MSSKDEKDEAAFTEGSKLTHETYKHLTTLSSGAIVIIATLLNKGGMKGTIVATFGLMLFLICNFLSICLMYSLARSLRYRNRISNYDKEYKSSDRLGIIIIAIFNLGLACIVWFASVNF